MLRADVVVAELQRLAQRQLQHLFRSRRKRDVPARRRSPRPMMSSTWRRTSSSRISEFLQRSGRHAVALVEQAEQDVFGPDGVVVEQPGLLLGQHHHPTGPVGEAFKHGDHVLAARPHALTGTGTHAPNRRLGALSRSLLASPRGPRGGRRCARAGALPPRTSPRCFHAGGPVATMRTGSAPARPARVHADPRPGQESSTQRRSGPCRSSGGARGAPGEAA